MPAQVLRYEALSLGLLHSTARNSLPLSDVADPTPAIDGPNPFAADKPDRKPSSNKLGPSNVHKPFNPKGPFLTFCEKAFCKTRLLASIQPVEDNHKLHNHFSDES